MSETKLLPCPNPWCRSVTGPSVESHTLLGQLLFRAQCNVCDLLSPELTRTEEDAAAAWNTRPTPALTPKQEAAEEMFEALESQFKKMHCVCKMLGYIGEEPPCETCKLGKVLAKAGRA